MAYNHWTVWSHIESNPAELRMLGQTINFQIPPYEPGRATGAAFLAPFSSYPRFIACDRQQYVYVIRADLQTGRAHQIGRTDNAVAASVLPDDESFMLIRGSPVRRSSPSPCLRRLMSISDA